MKSVRLAFRSIYFMFLTAIIGLVGTNNLFAHNVFNSYSGLANASTEESPMSTSANPKLVKLYELKLSDNLLVVSDTDTHDETVESSSNNVIVSTWISQNGSLLIVASRNGKIYRWDVGKRQTVSILDTQKELSGLNLDIVEVSDGGKTLIGFDEDRNSILWDIDTAQPIYKTDRWKDGRTQFAFSPSNNFLVLSVGGIPSIWDVQSKKQIFVFPFIDEPNPHNNPIGASAPVFSPDGSLVAFVYTSGTIQIWDVKARKLVTTIDALANIKNDKIDASLIKMKFSPDNSKLLGLFLGPESNKSYGVRVWDIATRTVLYSQRNAYPADFTSDSLHLIYNNISFIDIRNLVTQRSVWSLKRWSANHFLTKWAFINDQILIVLQQYGDWQTDFADIIQLIDLNRRQLIFSSKGNFCDLTASVNGLIVTDDCSSSNSITLWRVE